MAQIWVNGGSIYTIVSGTWTEAQAQAVAMGGNLVTVNSAAENDFLWTSIVAPNAALAPNGMWIGLTDSAEEGVWTWISGEPVTFTSWQGGEPNNYWGNEDWAAFWQGSRWNDLRDITDEGVTAGIVEIAALVPGSADGTSGDDVMHGDDLRNIFNGDRGNDTLLGGAGNDSLWGDAGNDSLDGGVGADRLYGMTGRDRLAGSGGADRILGGGGKDTLVGGAGDDTLTGGSGRDVFLFRAGDGKDVITDLADDLDELRLDQALWGGGLSVAEVLADYGREVSGDVVLGFESGASTIRLHDITLAQLANDVVLL